MTSKEIRFKINQLLTQQQTIALAGFKMKAAQAFDRMAKEVESPKSAFQIEERLAEGRQLPNSFAAPALRWHEW